MRLSALFGLTVVVCSASAAPFTGWFLGENNNNGGGKLLTKVQQFGEKVYERKRDFLNGVNEKVSNMLWIPPLPTTPSTGYQDQPAERDEQLIFSSNDETIDDEHPNLAIYARSSFLSPDDLSEGYAPAVNKPRVTVNVNNNFNLLGRSWS